MPKIAIIFGVALINVRIFCLLTNDFFSIWDFLSRSFTNHRTTGERGGYFFNSYVPLLPASQTLSH